MGKTKDGVVPQVGQTLYRVWNGDVESITVLAFEVLPGVDVPAVEYSDDGIQKIRVSANVFYASLEVALTHVRTEALEAVVSINEQIAELLKAQIEIVGIIHTTDKKLEDIRQ